MVINLTHRPDLEDRVERLSDRLDLRGRGRKTATIERALTAPEERLASERPDQAAIEASLDRYIEAGARLRRRLVGSTDAGRQPPLSLSLPQSLYDESGLPE